MKFSTQQKSGVYLIPTSTPIPFLNRKSILLPLCTVAVSNAEPKSQDNFAFTGGSDEETYFEVKCLQLSDNDKKNAVFQKKYGVLWSVRPIEIFAEIHDFQGFAGLHPLFFCRFHCDGYGFSTRGSILVFDQKRCPLYPCQKID